MVLIEENIQNMKFFVDGTADWVILRVFTSNQAFSVNSTYRDRVF